MCVAVAAPLPRELRLKTTPSSHHLLSKILLSTTTQHTLEWMRICYDECFSMPCPLLHSTPLWLKAVICNTYRGGIFLQVLPWRPIWAG